MGTASDREMSTRDGITREGTTREGTTREGTTREREGTALSMPRATTGGLGAGLGGLGGWGAVQAATRLRPRPFVSAEMPTAPPPRPQPKRGSTISAAGGAAPPPGAAAANAANAAATNAAAALPAAQSNPGGRLSPSFAPRPGAVSPTGREIVAAGADGSRVSPPRRDVSPPPPGNAAPPQPTPQPQRQRGMARTGHTRHAAAASPAKPQPGVSSPKGGNAPDPQPTFEALPALGGGVARGAGSAAAAVAPPPPKAETARGRAEAAKAEAQMRSSGQVRHLVITPSRCVPAAGCGIPTASSHIRRVTFRRACRTRAMLTLALLTIAGGQSARAGQGKLIEQHEPAATGGGATKLEQRAAFARQDDALRACAQRASYLVITP